MTGQKCCQCDRELVAVIPYYDYDSDETPDNVGIAAKSKTSVGAICARCRREGKTIVAVTRTENAGVTRIEEGPDQSDTPIARPAPRQALTDKASAAIRKAAKAFRNALVDRDR